MSRLPPPQQQPPQQLSLSAYASNFLRNPISNPFGLPTDDDDDDDEGGVPLFHSTLPGTSSSRRPAAAGEAAESSTASLPHVFNSLDSLGAPAGYDRDEDEHNARVLFDRHDEPAGSDDDEDDDGGAFLGRVVQAERERDALLGGGDARGRASSTAVPPPDPPSPPFRTTVPPSATPPASKKGWIAHQSTYPATESSRAHPHRSRSRSASISSSSSSSASSSTSSSSSSSADGGLPHGYLQESGEDNDDELHGYHAPRAIDVLPRTERRAERSILGERLLGARTDSEGRLEGGVERLIAVRGGFGGRGDWRKFRDSPFLALHLTCLIALLVFLPFTLSWSSPKTPSAPSTSPGSSTPFRTLLHTLPLLSLLLLLSTCVPPLFLFALRKGVRVALVGAACAGPLGLVVCAWWLFLGSFEVEDEGSGWWGQTGMRLLSLLPFLAAALGARLLWVRRKKLARTIGVVELASELLISHPPLLVLTPALLLAFSLVSIPFLTVVLRLFLLGYYESPPEGSYSYHLKPRAHWLLVLVIALWLWTWGVFRGVGRVTVSGVVGEWYFHRDDPQPAHTHYLRETDPFGLGFDIETTRIAFNRATGPSLGSICLSALVLTMVKTSHRLAVELSRATSPTRLAGLPDVLRPLGAMEPIAGIVAGVLEQLNGYALVYVGVTGEPFLRSARAVGALLRRRARGSGRKLLDYTLVKLLLDLASAALAVSTGTTGYLFALHALHAPGSHAPLAGILCGGAVFLSVRLAVDALVNASDALFVCYAIDAENGGANCPRAGEAFGGVKRTTTVGEAV